jgi:hypothetical protein
MHSQIQKQLLCCRDKTVVLLRACAQCWPNYEYFMLKQCLENIGEGLLHACISGTVYVGRFLGRHLRNTILFLWANTPNASCSAPP